MAARGTRAKGAKRAAPPFRVPPGWTLDRGGKSMSLRLRTSDFMEAVAIVNAVAPVAERLEHHPDIHLEEWNKLRITTWSHDVGGLTKRDERLAKAISEVLASRWPSPG
jgi:4a-hydroxytetrahydrobiopterin dehydratase